MLACSQELEYKTRLLAAKCGATQRRQCLKLADVHILFLLSELLFLPHLAITLCNLLPEEAVGTKIFFQFKIG